MARILMVLAVVASMGCYSCARKGSENEATVAPSDPGQTRLEPPGRADVPPRLVVLIVMDQLASWVLDTYLPILPKNSLLREVAENHVYHQAAFPYACTQTAPGHASLTTGVPPSIHGVAANALYDPKHGSRKTVDDKKHAVIRNPERFVSPLMLQAPTVADALRQKHGPDARIVGISMKARSAVLAVGQKPNAAVFFDQVSRSMTTSTYYQPNGRLPEWLRDFVKANPVESLLQVWEPEQPAWLESHFGPDTALGEMYPFFPHDPNDAPDPYSAFSSLPESTEYLIAAAFAAVKGEDMGLDEIPDFLMLGISGTDIVGHIWGPTSWEYADNLVGTDRALGRFVKLLRSRGPVAFVLTADHGIAALPEQAHSEGHDSGRLAHDAVVRHAEKAASAALGNGDWIEAYVPPLITYTAAGKQQRKALNRALSREMPKLEGVRAVYDAHDGATLRGSARDIERLVGASLPVDPPGDLYLVTEEGWFDALAQRGGTNHGSPWPYDRQVPIMMWGTGIEPRTSNQVYSVLTVATTLAALLDVPAPDLAPQDPLPGVMRFHD